LNSASFSRFRIAKATVLNQQRLSHIPWHDLLTEKEKKNLPNGSNVITEGRTVGHTEKMVIS
jgi:hypothetical protein